MTNSSMTTDQIRSSDPLASSLHSQPIAPPPTSPPPPPPCPPLQYQPSPPPLRLPTPLHLPNPLFLLIQHHPRAPGPRRRRLAIQPFHQPLARHQNRPVHSCRWNPMPAAQHDRNQNRLRQRVSGAGEAVVVVGDAEGEADGAVGGDGFEDDTERC
jgi:hypothetical protein